MCFGLFERREMRGGWMGLGGVGERGEVAWDGMAGGSRWRVRALF